MIELTNLAQQKMWINPDLIRSFEQTPDTTLCFIDGMRLPVRETPDEVQKMILNYRRQIFANQNQQQGNLEWK